MKLYIHTILLSFLIILASVSAHAEVEAEKFFKIDQEYNKAIDAVVLKFLHPLEDIDENMASYSRLISTFESFKKFNLNLGKSLLEKVEHGEPLSGDDLYSLRRTISTYYKINKKMLEFAKLYNFGGFEMSKSITESEFHLPLIKAHLIFLSGHIQVLDHIEKMHSLYYQSSSLFRRIIKKSLKDKDHVGSKTLNDLIKMSEYTVNIGNSKKFSNQIILVRNINDEIFKILETEVNATSLLNIIMTNETSINISQGKQDFIVSYHGFIDSLTEFFSKLSNWLSSIFGNIAGNIKWRTGFLFENESAIAMMNEKLKPMDILLEKSPFVLTDKFIPGHFGHAALYLGTKEQLEAINMWNHPDIIPYQEDISAGRVILEAIRSGVHLATVAEFSNIDEVTIARKKDALENVDVLIESISRGMDQVGKEYDFNFDVETLDKIVCSELIYIVYGQVHWPTKYRMSRATISPDDVAEVLFQKNTKFSAEQILISPERHRIEIGTLDALGRDLDFELRSSEDGSNPDSIDSTKNSFWKKSEKCFNVNSMNATGRGGRANFKKECKTTYTQEFYEERVSAN